MLLMKPADLDPLASFIHMMMLYSRLVENKKLKKNCVCLMLIDAYVFTVKHVFGSHFILVLLAAKMKTAKI